MGVDLALLLIVPFISRIGIFALPALHLLIRGIHALEGSIPAPKIRDHQQEISATIAWVKKHQELLGSDGRLICCGYSSGGHCASLYALSAGAPRFEAVILISGIYSLRTHVWTGGRTLLRPIFNMVYKDILGVSTAESQDKNSPEIQVKQPLQTQNWYVLTAKKELMGIPVLE